MLPTLASETAAAFFSVDIFSGDLLRRSPSGHGGAATCREASHEIFFATIVVLFLHHMKIFLLRSYNMIFFLLQLFCDFATIV